MGILLWIVFGFVVGLSANWIMPKSDLTGIVVTNSLGVWGAVFGGTFGTAFGLGDLIAFDVRCLLMAIGGAMILLAGYRLSAMRTIA